MSLKSLVIDPIMGKTQENERVSSIQIRSVEIYDCDLSITDNITRIRLLDPQQGHSSALSAYEVSNIQM